ncbi:uncharacterized protein LOC114358071 isoform X2 [Ostrinia furnacalis]|uniref:uncharacterized protein LOC114358071 isoform X2 n=1 Tax=Ostrinia furnacalis TaxID=93504 RepID=UPI00103F3D40|nr:uncharacterized protein LOC114358071 isoform X2 [Ostrinia furnacalis]
MPKERRKSRQDDYEDCDDDNITHNPTHMLQLTAELVPRYSGRDNTYPVSRWIEDVESNAEIFGWSPLQQLLVARRSLTDTAQLWLRSERPFKSWDDLKAAICKEFPDTVDIKAIHEQMSARKKRVDETCLDYMLIMKELGKRGKMPDYVAIKYIVDGIVDVETNKIMLYGVTTYNDLKEKLKIYETISRKMQSAVQQRRAVSTSKQQSDRRGSWKIRCYSCGETGHASTDCPHKSKGMKCFKCNQFGHVGSACTSTATANRKTSEEFGKSRQDDHRQKKSAMFAADITRDCGASSGELWNELQDYQHHDKKRTMFTTSNSIEGSAPSGSSTNDDEPKMATFVYDEMSTLSTSQINKTEEKKPVIVLTMNEIQQKALVDSGSDVNIISEDVYIELGKPKCEKDDLVLSGIGQGTVRSLGKCLLNLCVDEQYYLDVIFHVINKEYVPYDVILGQEFLNDVTVVIKKGCVKFYTKEWERLGCYVSEVCSSNSVVGPMKDPALREEVIECIQKYKPEQTEEAPLQLKIVLKDEVPVALRPRRLALKEQEIVEEQIAEWLEKDIIRVSHSEYSSPLVLVKKKDNSIRVCVDYRMLNRKIMKDEFPLPVIEDLIDKLKDAKMYSVLGLKNGFFHLRSDMG